ncbi:MAG: class I SAM-dependent methyltransferase [bacterium]
MSEEITRVNEVYGTFSERFPILYNRDGRVAKANKIVAVMNDFSGRRLKDLQVLDIGGSAGVMTEVFADAFEKVTEIDIDHVAIEEGRKSCEAENVDWVCGDATKMPFADKSFDCLICNHVYEHIDDQQALMAEIKRVLKDDGFCYFSAGSRFVLVEGHYFLPFLSWLPHRVSDIYMRVTGRQGRYDVKLLSHRNLKKLLQGFEIHDYTLLILTEPERFAAHDLQAQNSLAFRIPRWIYKRFYPILPIWIWVLSKK